MRLDPLQCGGAVASELDQQLSQLDELLGLLDASALRGAQEALENQIAELTERMEVTRQALSQAQVQRRRLARARLLLEESSTHEPTNGNGDPALRPAPPKEPGDEETVAETPGLEPAVGEGTAPESPGPAQPLTATAPFAAERRQSEERRANGERRQTDDRRKNHRLPQGS